MNAIPVINIDLVPAGDSRVLFHSEGGQELSGEVRPGIGRIMEGKAGRGKTSRNWQRSRHHSPPHTFSLSRLSHVKYSLYFLSNFLPVCRSTRFQWKISPGIWRRLVLGRRGGKEEKAKEKWSRGRKLEGDWDCKSGLTVDRFSDASLLYRSFPLLPLLLLLPFLLSSWKEANGEESQGRSFFSFYESDRNIDDE